VAFTANKASLDVMSAVANRSPVSIASASCTRVAGSYFALTSRSADIHSRFDARRRKDLVLWRFSQSLRSDP
jgi:hypothetical protein